MVVLVDTDFVIISLRRAKVTSGRQVPVIRRLGELPGGYLVLSAFPYVVPECQLARVCFWALGTLNQNP